MLKIMIVDDDRDVVELINYILKNDNYEVCNAYSGKDALEKLGLLPTSQTQFLPDLMVLDIMLPDVDGYTIYTKMSEVGRTGSIPVVIMTAKGHVRELFSMSKNVIDFIEKPFDTDVVKAKLDKILADIASRKE